jgi:hypothetical protein
MSDFDWDLYKIYKADVAPRMSAYLSYSIIPELIQKDIVHDAIVDSILYKKDTFTLCKSIVSTEAAHHNHRVCEELIDTKGCMSVDSIYTSARPDIHTLITGVDDTFIKNYCTEKDIKILIALLKYKTPMEVGNRLGISNILVSRRVYMIKVKYKKYKLGIKIKRFNNVGDKYELDTLKIDTPLKKAVADLYLDNTSYKRIAEILETTTMRIACIIYAIRKR